MPAEGKGIVVAEGRANLALVYLLISFLYGVTSFLSGRLIYTEDFYSRSLAGFADQEGILKLLAIQKKWQWLGFCMLPVIVFFKILFSTICVYIGALFRNCNTQWCPIFRITLWAELVFWVQALCRLIYFLVVPPATLQAVSNFAPLSLMTIFKTNEMAPPVFFVLQSLNLFELAYCLFIAWQLKAITGQSFKHAFFLVGKSYGTGLLLWLAIMVFFIIQFS